MKIGSTRELAGLKPVLKDPEATGPDPVYWVFAEVGADPWDNVTITAPGRFSISASLDTGGEYPKTFGHYHPVDAQDELYKLITGEGIFMMQKKKIVDGNWVEDEVEAVCLIKAQPGEEIVIKPEWGHSWSNIGSTPLITFDNWTFGHSPSDYELIERLKGLAYYLIEENGEPEATPNPNYKNLPEPEWLTVAEFKQKYLE
jgi:oxalate decarboxylase/phosphoglucose isomerase-like protein (cupin superfamily)